MIRNIAAILVFLLVLPAIAGNNADFIEPIHGTRAVAVSGGDTIQTYKIAVTTYTATLLLAADTADRTRRRVCFEPAGAYEVDLGSATTSGNEYWVVNSTVVATAPSVFCSNSVGAWYGERPAGGSAGTVLLEVESASLP